MKHLFSIVLDCILTRLGYIGEFEEIDDHRSGKIVIQLNGRLNKCGVISPRFNIRLPDLENWVNQLLPARSTGYVVLPMNAGIMDREARRKLVARKDWDSSTVGSKIRIARVQKPKRSRVK